MMYSRRRRYKLVAVMLFLSSSFAALAIDPVFPSLAAALDNHSLLVIRPLNSRVSILKEDEHSTTLTWYLCKVISHVANATNPATTTIDVPAEIKVPTGGNELLLQLHTRLASTSSLDIGKTYLVLTQLDSTGHVAITNIGDLRGLWVVDGDHLERLNKQREDRDSIGQLIASASNNSLSQLKVFFRGEGK